MEEYFKGNKLYGDDFTMAEILQWYKEEEEAYANLALQQNKPYRYKYHKVNKIHAFNKLKHLHFKHALGFGAAFGEEFIPIICQIDQITIVEPSEQLRSQKIGHLTPTYVKPDVKGDLPFANDTFDLITCLGVLHHICNVSFVLSELIRVLSPGGYLIIREPIISMGDWRKPRPGLTKNERGIPVTLFKNIFNQQGVVIVSESYLFTLNYHFDKLYSKFFDSSINENMLYLYFDKFLSSLTKMNLHYHATSRWQRIAPNAAYFIVKKE
ncbi:MAG TPA: class I SAM-dependent methyltransferase [Bacteroidales bacterium]|nr:class I SAM-dependent methyltransferase [Bacteroidales bacterium]HOK97780.1 class I SAM-dependent methyltransferase [Bacteroidales bacterium]HPO64724.1 class I SAM-dependent methyltransferase [Bacteroidales bacterium]